MKRAIALIFVGIFALIAIMGAVHNGADSIYAGIFATCVLAGMCISASYIFK